MAVAWHLRSRLYAHEVASQRLTTGISMSGVPPGSHGFRPAHTAVYQVGNLPGATRLRQVPPGAGARGAALQQILTALQAQADAAGRIT
ncbi:hypothetical protein GCM10023074_29280 [Microbispora amethystogenes]